MCPAEPASSFRQCRPPFLFNECFNGLTVSFEIGKVIARSGRSSSARANRINPMPKGLLRYLCVLGAMAALAGGASAESRIKDLVDIEGVRENQLVGYGLVV